MAGKKGFTLKEQVPEFSSPLRMAALFVILIFSILAILTSFWLLDRIHMYGSLNTQLFVAAWLSIALYYSMQHLIYRVRAKCEETGVMPWWRLPGNFTLIFAPWYACLIHPLADKTIW